jgi:hypothetical protein
VGQAELLRTEISNRLFVSFAPLSYFFTILT